jgi:short-subunit dehydrogenase
LEGTGIHVQALCPGYTFTKATQPLDRSQLPRIVSWMSPEEVVNKSLNALGNKQVVYIPGYRNRLIATLYWMRARIKNLRVYLLSGSEKKVKITVLMVMAGGFLTFF